jgi:hypothetical protein
MWNVDLNPTRALYRGGQSACILTIVKKSLTGDRENESIHPQIVFQTNCQKTGGIAT